MRQTKVIRHIRRTQKGKVPVRKHIRKLTKNLGGGPFLQKALEKENIYFLGTNKEKKRIRKLIEHNPEMIGGMKGHDKITIGFKTLRIGKPRIEYTKDRTKVKYIKGVNFQASGRIRTKESPSRKEHDIILPKQSLQGVTLRKIGENRFEVNKPATPLEVTFRHEAAHAGQDILHKKKEYKQQFRIPYHKRPYELEAEEIAWRKPIRKQYNTYEDAMEGFRRMFK